MRKHCGFAVRSIILFIVIVLCLMTINKVLIPKNYYNRSWNSSATYTGFYEMERNSIDVLFLGSSHGACGFIPQELYNNYGITSYNLSCEQQSILVSYYWLKEALKYQKPKAVVLDLYLLFPFKPEDPLNSSEGTTRKAVDYMKDGSIKNQLIKDICKYDEQQSELSYYLKNIRFHKRWEELNRDDFIYNELEEHFELKGFSAFNGKTPDSGYEPFAEDAANVECEIMPLMYEYLMKILDTCRQNEIELVLVKTPTLDEVPEKYIAGIRIAEEAGLKYYNFNERQLYNQIGFDFENDMTDANHAGISGAVKMTNFIGKILTEECHIQKRNCEEFNSTREYYANVLQDSQLKNITDIYEYLEQINQERYTIFISANCDASEALNPEIVERIQKLGMKCSLAGQQNASYLAVMSDKEIYEEYSFEKIQKYGTLHNGAVRYELISMGDKYFGESSIIIDGREYSKNQQGLNFVIYSNETQKVVDSICFNTGSKELKATR